MTLSRRSGAPRWRIARLLRMFGWINAAASLLLAALGYGFMSAFGVQLLAFELTLTASAGFLAVTVHAVRLAFETLLIFAAARLVEAADWLLGLDAPDAADPGPHATATRAPAMRSEPPLTARPG